MMDRKALKKLKKLQRKSSQQSSASVPGSRGRRGGLGAFHFKQEKQHKQLVQYAREGKSGELRELLEAGLELEDVDYGIPALLSACSYGYLEVVAVLLRFGAHVNTCGDAECAPIHAAARKGHILLRSPASTKWSGFCWRIKLTLTRGTFMGQHRYI